MRTTHAAARSTKLNPGSDRDFYAFPRLVKHVDDRFLAQVTQLYRQRIPEGAAVLDLGSSWVSHLPPEKRYARVVGHGMNAQVGGAYAAAAMCGGEAGSGGRSRAYQVAATLG
jgi:hypothetical protein